MRDKNGLLLKRMEECVDGEYQTFKSKDGAYVRKHFFGKYPELLEMVATMSDDDIWRLNRGGHDPHKIYAAYAAAMKHTGQPTVILAKTIKGYGMGEAGEGAEHHPPAEEDGHVVDQGLPRPLQHAGARRQARRSAVSTSSPEGSPGDASTCASGARRWAASLPARRRKADAAGSAAAVGLRGAAEGHRRGPRDVHHHGLRAHPRHHWSATRRSASCVVPIVPDESRTFGMEGMFRQLGIYSHVGQLYTPQDADQLMFYKEDKSGQILQEGINEAGAMSSWIAAATSYSTQRHADDPVLHLLLDVRLPAHRRSGLGGGRHARARLPAGRHRRAHHAERRRPAARGRPQPPAGLDHSELRVLRPDLRLRTGGDHPGRHAPHVPGAGGRLLLHHRDERELPASGDAGGRGGGHPQGHVSAARRQGQEERSPRCSCWAAARSCAR